MQSSGNTHDRFIIFLPPRGYYFSAPTIRLWVTEDLATSQDLLPPSLLKL